MKEKGSLEEAGACLSMAVHSHEQPQIHGEATLDPPCPGLGAGATVGLGGPKAPRLVAAKL